MLTERLREPVSGLSLTIEDNLMRNLTSATQNNTNNMNTGYRTASAAISECIKQFVTGGLADSVVKTANGLMVFNRFQMRVRASEINEVIFSVHRENTLQEAA